MAENQYPADEFDELAATRTVRGAHRRKESNAKWWAALAAIIVIAPLVGWGAIQLVGSTGSSLPKVTATQSPAATNSPTTPSVTETPSEPPNFDLPVEILNSSDVEGYAAVNQEILWDAGFTDVATGNYWGDDAVATQVFYPDEAFAVTANEVAGTLGIPQDSDYVVMGGVAEGGAAIVVVLAGEFG
ncbi:MAG: LytR C-terminal domain-containing protein [Ancrocorticia sp.]